MMETFNDPRRCEVSVWTGNIPILCIEGGMGVGKTTFASGVAKGYGALVLSTDYFSRPQFKGESYVELVDTGALVGAITGALRPIVIEGICLRAILPNEICSAAKFLYVKRISDVGIWHLGEEVAGPPKAGRSFDPGWLDREVEAYHREYSPHVKCEYILELPELPATELKKI